MVFKMAAIGFSQIDTTFILKWLLADQNYNDNDNDNENVLLPQSYIVVFQSG